MRQYYGAVQAGGPCDGESRWAQRVDGWLRSLGAQREPGQRSVCWHLAEVSWGPADWTGRRRLIEHRLCEAWRRRLWQQFLESARVDARCLREAAEAAYDEAACAGARRLYQQASRHARKILEGGAVSLARAAHWRISGEGRQLRHCPWCAAEMFFFCCVRYSIYNKTYTSHNSCYTSHNSCYNSQKYVSSLSGPKFHSYL